MSRGRGVGFRQNANMGPGMGRGMGAGRGQGLGLRRRDGSCQRMQNQGFGPDQYASDLERRIAGLEAENQRLRAEMNK
ncbi:hypothetical protein [Maridesulfovibrio sp.]|uniref:hypothetical protein n=1 Tax=Maridesulfovibrio sp. TaxID=2795000 RepID=UPI003BA8A121